MGRFLILPCGETTWFGTLTGYSLEPPSTMLQATDFVLYREPARNMMTLRTKTDG